MKKREYDSEHFIRPQRQWADMVVSFCPSNNDAVQNDLLLDARLILRPTISQPDLSDILENQTNQEQSAVRLGLTRDMGQPADLLEIDGHATAAQVQALERLLCNEVSHLGQFCSLQGNEDIGKVTGTTGETLQSYPLAITQLLITYHMLKAARVQL
jgi:phosphoribulokinase